MATEEQKRDRTAEGHVTYQKKAGHTVEEDDQVKIVTAEDSETSSIDEKYDVDSVHSSIAEEEHLTWQGQMKVALHGTTIHTIIIILVVVDALIVLFELLLEVGALGTIYCHAKGLLPEAEFCHYDNVSRAFCPPHAELILRGINISAGNGTGFCKCGFKVGRLICLRSTEEIGVNPAAVLHALSLAILCIFMVEIIMKIIAFGMPFFTHKFEVFDATVVLLSWILDVASQKEEQAFDAAGLLIMLRLWRVVRIFNGAVLSSKSRADSELKKVGHQKKKVIHALHKCQEKLASVEDANLQLKTLLEENKIPVPAKLVVVEVVQPGHVSHGSVAVEIPEGKQYLFEKLQQSYR
ncbi:hypothetical protein EMCRGX_G022070 [Ephydatia muelleri]